MEKLVKTKHNQAPKTSSDAIVKLSSASTMRINQ